MSSIVYWASPFEMPSIFGDKKIMATNNFVKTRLIMDKILDNINSGDKVGIKIHTGEAYTSRYLRHEYILEIVNAVKAKGGIPTLIETQGLGMYHQQLDLSENYSICVGCRKTTSDHKKIVNRHGYSESIVGAPFKFLDGEKGIDSKMIKIDGIQLKEVAVAVGLFEYDKIVVVSHFKGHALAGFGGALKQLGVGCVSKQNKYVLHYLTNLTINTKRCNISKCAQECVKSCPVNAIKIEENTAVLDNEVCVSCIACLESCPVKRAINSSFNYTDFKGATEKVADNTLGVINSFGAENIRYINIAIDIAKFCDCQVTVGMPVIPDLGIFGSSDPLAIDKACVDAETNAPGLPFLDFQGNWSQPLGQGIEKFKALNPSVDTTWLINAAVKNKLGSIDYELVKI